MKRKMKHRLSLRMRVTIISGATLICVCLLLSWVIIYNAQTWIIGPALIYDSEYNPISDSSDGNIKEDEIDDYAEAYNVEIYGVDNFYLFTYIGVIVSLLIGIILIYIVTGMSIKPVKYLRDEITTISENDLSKRINDFSAGDELDALANSFNQMLERIEYAFVREKSFTAGAAHELKTPLAVIKTNLDVLNLSDNPNAEDYKGTFVVVQNHISRMSKLVDDMFSMYLMEGYKIDEIISVDDIVNEALTEQIVKVENKNITIEKSLSRCLIKANSIMLKHAIFNLIDNAIKYNKDYGTINLTVKEVGKYCVITVKDTGIGVSSTASEHIFEPFYREDKSRSRQLGGAGLGLSIVNDILNQHKGTMRYYPNEPSGSVFEISIPTV